MPDPWDTDRGQTHYYGDGCDHAHGRAQPCGREHERRPGECDTCDKLYQSLIEDDAVQASLAEWERTSGPLPRRAE